MTPSRATDDRALLSVLGKYVSAARAQAVLMRARGDLRVRQPSDAQLVARLVEGLRLFVGEADARAAQAELTRVLAPKAVEAVEIEVRVEADIARARLAARDASMALGTSALILQKVATVVSELARNMVLYAGGGTVTIRPCSEGRRCLHVIARDEGKGIPNLPEILSGRYKSRSGLGLGILGTKRLSDKFEIETGPTGTRIECEVNY
ncbi:MAG TPA: ATP-binding protein [Nannocystis sp.]